MVEKETVRRSYDELADAYAARRSEDGRGMEILAEFLGSLSDPAYVLDAGCGQGTPVMSRLRDSASPVGVDISREQLRLAAVNAPGSHLAQGDMTALPFVASAFDAVVAYWSLIHVPMDEHRTVVSEFARVLRPGGRLLLCEGTEEWVGENPDWLDSGVRMEWEIAGAKRTREQLEDVGFAVVDRWGVPETLEGSGDDARDSRDDTDASEGDDHPWAFFSARLDA